MRSLVFIIAMLAGLLCIGLTHVKAAPQPTLGIAATKAKVGPIEEIGWRRRYYRRGYMVPYAYYPPAYGYYYPPPAYYAPAYPAYPYYAPSYRYYRPYYAPYY
jgi:hypothetical protein